MAGLLLGVALIVSGCGQKSSTDSQTKKSDEKVYKIGVTQITDHPSLDNCREGFIEGLKNEGYVDGKNADIEFKSAQNDMSLATQIALAACIPMLMDTGGNAGSQASVTVIRGMSIGEIEFSDILRVIWKEIRVAALCGITLAAANFVKLLVVERVGIMVAAVVCITLPMVASKIGFDPAVMASPFITTIVDAISLFIYFEIATALLKI